MNPSRWLAAGFLAPALVLLGFIVVYPIVFTVIRSFFDATGNRFVGVGNYTNMFTDQQTLVSIRNTAIWVVVAPTVVTALGLVFAVLTERIKWSAAFKLIVFMPMAVSFLASGVIFRLVYQQSPDSGVANAIITSVHDTFAPSSSYPGAHPRPNADLAPQGKAYATKTAARPGQAVLLPLVGMKAADLPKGAAKAVQAAARPGALTGTVWLDFTLGGGGAPGKLDPAEKGMPAMTVEAVSGGRTVQTATTGDDGTFAFTGLKPGSYTVRLAASNFAAPYGGVTWLGPALITPSIIGAYVWVWAGFAMVLIAAGLAAIPREALEAARVDGATEWQVFRRVTMPLLAPVLTVVFVTLAINVLKIFDLVFIIAPGSVQSNASVLALDMWRDSFGGGNDYGLGSAVSVVLFILVVPAMIMNIRRFRREQG
ncbi:MAG TPA: ABC transporter permease subunit [Streptosporangiaceae bacterium]